MSRPVSLAFRCDRYGLNPCDFRWDGGVREIGNKRTGDTVKKALIAFIVTFFLPSAALAGFHDGAPPPPSACPWSAYAPIDDGCSGASPGLNTGVLSSNLSYQNPNLLAPAGTANSIFQSGQIPIAPFHDLADPTHSHVNWDVAGKDFPVGVAPCAAPAHCPASPVSPGAYCTGAFVSLDNPPLPCARDTSGALTPLIDASTYDWAHDANAGFANVGCTAGINWATVGPVHLYSAECKTASVNNVQGFDFGPAVTTDGGISYHNICAGFILRDDNGGATSGTLTFANNCVFWSGEASCEYLITNGYEARTQPINIAIRAGNYWVVKVWNNRVDGNIKNSYKVGAPMFIGKQTSPITIGWPLQTTEVVQATSVSVRYNYVTDISNRFITNIAACGGFEMIGNVVHNIGDYSAGTHGAVNITQPTVSGGVQTTRCGPVAGKVYNYANGTYPVTTPNGWAGSTWGAQPYVKFINNTAWTDSTVRGDGSWLLNGNFENSVADLLDVQVGQWELNTLIPNPAQDPGGRIWFESAGTNSGRFSGKTFTGGGAYAWAAGDVLSMNISNCAPGATSYSSYPTVTVTSATRVQIADQGNCGYADPGIRNRVHLYCVYCQNGGTGDTGWTVSGVTFITYNESTDLDIIGQGTSLSGGFTNYESLTIANNLAEASKLFQGIPFVLTTYMMETFHKRNGQYLSCNVWPPQLPVGTDRHFFTLGNGVTSTDPAVISNNFQSDGTTATVEPFATDNGC